MQVVVGAMSPLLRKLGDLLMAEFSLGKKTRKSVEYLRRELTVMHATLHKVGEVPPEELDPMVRVWARQVRELSYDMEDAVDDYMVRVKEKEGAHHAGDPPNLKNRVKKFIKKTSLLFSKGRELHEIAAAINEDKELAMQLAELRQRYGLELNGATAAGASSIDPRLTALYKDVRELIGINSRSNELIEMLLAPDGSEHLLKTVAIVGVGGLGKTTLVRAVYDKIVKMSHFDCGAFVSIGRNPDMNKVFKDIIYGVSKEKFPNIHNAAMDEKLLIDEVKQILAKKRYFIIIDDIWDENKWEFIKCAFPENNFRNRVITTTRIVSVAQKCRASHHGIYKMKPLSRDDSKTLFYKRIFTDGKCPQDLLEISEDILKKCGGIPLAIITISSLLANKQVKTEEQWATVLKSIGRGMTEGGIVEDMRKILSFSYHDLPSHLKACLLYLRVFPEDYNIRRDRLIWTWIAQGFIQHKEAENNLFELGESCLNELVNRNMIHLVDSDADSDETYCCLHDMVHDLICSLSREENFVSTLDDVGQSTCLQIKVRRLSLQVQGSRVEQTSPIATVGLSHVRSFPTFRAAVNLIPSLQRFHILRVLDLEGRHLWYHCDFNLEHILKLFDLTYLGLRNTCIGGLPRGLEKLRLLQTLDLKGANIKNLPSAVARLGQLMSLYVDFQTNLPERVVGHLTSTQVLSGVSIRQNPGFVRELCNLTGLKELHIGWVISSDSKALEEELVEALHNLNKIQTLRIYCDFQDSLDVMEEHWVAPPHLRRFELHGTGYYSTMPAWIKMDPLVLTELSVLFISFGRLLQAEDMQIFGRLPALTTLTIRAPCKRWIVGPGVSDHPDPDIGENPAEPPHQRTSTRARGVNAKYLGPEWAV